MAKKLLALIRQRLNVTTTTGEVTLLENVGHQGIRGIEMEMLQEGMHHFQAEEGITNFALMAYTPQGSSSSSSSDSELLKKSNLEIIGYQIGLESLEARIVVHEKNEAVYEEDIAFLNRESDVDNSPINDRFKIGEGFHAVPPPYTENYMPSRPDLSFAGLDDSVYKTKNVKSVKKENTHKQVEYPRKSQSPRGNRRNWNGMMTQKLGNDFEFIKKACFVCGSFNHLIKDCDFHDKKMVEKPVLNNKGRVTGQREIRPVWNNAQRVNHQHKFTHPHPKRNFIPTTVVTKLGQVPVNAAKQSSPRAASSISTARPVNTARRKVNTANGLGSTSGIRACALRNFDLEVMELENTQNNALAKLPMLKLGEYEMWEIRIKQYFQIQDYALWEVIENGNSWGNPQYALQDQGIFDSGCSRHMTGSKSYLTDYQDIDGGFVAFAGSPKGGKITGKDKKNSVLFTETECLVLSLDFKLLDESQVLLKVPRQNNMYS
ncbi:hypothetical protein Tco_0888216 [Tanacetum coccineum]